MDDPRAELERLHPASFGWALHCCRGREEAEDVLQSAYLKVLEGRARFDGRSDLKTWLFGVIRRTAADARRRRWLRGLVLTRWWNGEPTRRPSPDPEGAAAQSETSRGLLAALTLLPPRQRDVLHLVFYQDLTIEEAAGVLGLRLGTARTHYERGKRALRARLDEEGR